MSEDDKQLYDYQARCLFAGHVAGQHGISIAYAWKRYAEDAELGDFWYEIARDLSHRTAQAIDQNLKLSRALELKQ